MLPGTARRRILILTADAGFGHRSAANAVAAALHDRYAAACTFEIANPLDDRRVPSVLRSAQDDYDQMITTAPKLFGLGFELSDAVGPATVMDAALTLMLFEPLYRLVRDIAPDAIVTTYPLYQAPLVAVFLILRHHVPLITVVTDLASMHALWFHNAADLCLVPTTRARDRAIQNGLPPAKIAITGIPVNPALSREPEDRAALRRALGWQPDLPTVLIVGSKRVGHVREVMRVLDYARLPVQVAVVAGGDDALYADLAAATWQGAVHVYNFVAELPRMLQAADCVLCKPGGLIVSESLAAGRPMIFVDALPGHEVGNAEYVIENGAGAWGRDPVAALDVLRRWLDWEGALLAERTAAARRLGRPQAAYDVAERAWLAAQQGPEPTRGHYRTVERNRLVAWLGRHNVDWQGEA